MKIMSIPVVVNNGLPANSFMLVSKREGVLVGVALYRDGKMSFHTGVPIDKLGDVIAINCARSPGA